VQLIAFGYLCGTRLIPVCDVAGIGEGVDGRRTVRRGPEDSGRIGNGPNAGGITRDLIDLQQIGNEADSIEDRQEVAGNVRNRHSRTRALSDFKQSILVERSGQIRRQHEARSLRQHHWSRIMRYGRNFCRRTSSLQAPRDDG
jgi:hypothetical protein